MDIAKHGSVVNYSDKDNKLTAGNGRLKNNIIGRDLSGGQRRIKNNSKERENEGVNTSLKTIQSPLRGKLANIIKDGVEEYSNQIDDQHMDKLSQKLNLDFQKFKSMRKESQKDVE